MEEYADRLDVVVLGLPRGGVPVAFAVAEVFGALLDILLVRKLGVPGHEKLAMGAIASGNVLVRNESVIRYLQIPEEVVAMAAAHERWEMQRREQAWRGDSACPGLAGRTVILVDDGVATGSTMRAAVKALRHSEPAQVIVAVPVAAKETCHELEAVADALVCPMKPAALYAVGAWYSDFQPVADSEVRALLQKARADMSACDGRAD